MFELPGNHTKNFNSGLDLRKTGNRREKQIRVVELLPVLKLVIGFIELNVYCRRIVWMDIMVSLCIKAILAIFET